MHVYCLQSLSGSMLSKNVEVGAIHVYCWQRYQRGRSDQGAAPYTNLLFRCFFLPPFPSLLPLYFQCWLVFCNQKVMNLQAFCP